MKIASVPETRVHVHFHKLDSLEVLFSG